MQYPESLATIRSRDTAIRAAVAHHGLRFRADHRVPVPAWTRTAARSAAAALFEHHAPPTAIMTMSDVAAYGVLEEARARSLRVPEDYSVIGMTDRPVSRFISPPLTCLRKPRYLMIRNAVDIVMSLRDGRISPPVNRRLASDVIIRQSTGPAPGLSAGAH
jgi:LacI family transcriptional regulator